MQRSKVAGKTAPLGEVAVVIGGSMAGLLAARIVAEHYHQVLILERDACPAEALPRKGVPQAQHAHALLARGQQILEELFPGLIQRLLSLGAVRGHGRFFAGGGYLCPVKRGPGGLFVSRLLLETEVRAYLLTLPNVRLVDRCAVQGLVTNENHTRIGGVRVQRRETGNGAEVISANLVVDAKPIVERIK
jgi:2-polyprenyl-6-methoxyphenol hydroxylase-like FAD-dependent oxidoreductase